MVECFHCGKMMDRNEGDPVFSERGQFWFYDETWAECFGPFVTEVEARAELEIYIRCGLEGKDAPPRLRWCRRPEDYAG